MARPKLTTAKLMRIYRDDEVEIDKIIKQSPVSMDKQDLIRDAIHYGIKSIKEMMLTVRKV